MEKLMIGSFLLGLVTWYTRLPKVKSFFHITRYDRTLLHVRISHCLVCAGVTIARENFRIRMDLLSKMSRLMSRQ